MRIRKEQLELMISAGAWRLHERSEQCPKYLSEWKEGTIVSASNIVQVQGESPRSPDNISKEGPGQRVTVVEWIQWNGAHQISIRVNGPNPVNRRTAFWPEHQFIYQG